MFNMGLTAQHHDLITIKHLLPEMSSSLQVMEPAAVAKMMQSIWDDISPTYARFVGDGMMAPASDRIVAAVKQHWKKGRDVHRGTPQSAEHGQDALSQRTGD